MEGVATNAVIAVPDDKYGEVSCLGDLARFALSLEHLRGCL